MTNENRPDDEPITAVEIVEESGGALQRSPLVGTAADGVAALGEMNEAEFDAKLEALERGQARIAKIKNSLMTADVHYGVIPGTNKPSLLKPGAEVLAHIYGIRVAFEPEMFYGDGEEEPAVRCMVRAIAHVGSLDGPEVAVGYGAASTHERKHRYRRADRTCPDCGTEGAIIRAKFGKKGWLCYDKKGGCGAEFDKADDRIANQYLGDVANPDQADLENTILKMAEKRAFIDVTLRATASSDLFTQDMDGNSKGGGGNHQRTGEDPPPPGGGARQQQEPVQRSQPSGGQREPDQTGIGELHEARALFTDGDGITEPQQRRLFAIARGMGWDEAGVEDALGQKLSLSNAGEIPKLGGAYDAIVGWFQNNRAGG